MQQVYASMWLCSIFQPDCVVDFLFTDYMTLPDVSGANLASSVCILWGIQADHNDGRLYAVCVYFAPYGGHVLYEGRISLMIQPTAGIINWLMP